MERQMDTLVLNTAYQPVRYVKWGKAFGMILSGRVEIVSFYKDRFIKTVSEVLQVPSVIRYIKGAFHKHQNKPARFGRRNVLLRDNSECCYCKAKLQRESFTYDHVIPASKGGKTNWKNIVSCCKKCNKEKRDRTPEEAGMRLLKKPYIPTHFEIANKGASLHDCLPRAVRGVHPAVPHRDRAGRA